MRRRSFDVSLFAVFCIHGFSWTDSDGDRPEDGATHGDRSETIRS
jgi:hypothetical protein